MSIVPGALAEQVRQQGFAIWPSYATASECDALRDAARILAKGEHAHHYPKSTRVWDLYQFDPIFTDMVTKPGLADLRDDLLGSYNLLSDYSLNVVPPRQPLDDWHIDYPFNEMHRLIPGGILGLQCVLALDPFTAESGATRLVPGSHAHPRRPDGDSPAAAETFLAEPGSLLIMAAATWHRSGRNVSAEPRAALLMSFVEKWIKPLSDPLPASYWVHDPRLEVLLGVQRPLETINGVPV